MTPQNQKEVMEEWKDIPGYEGKYQASNKGRIKSFIFRESDKTITLYKNPKILKGGMNNGGYLTMSLLRHGKTEQFLIHQLILMSFVGPCDAGMEVAHLNGCRTDNRLENLKYCTRSENHSHKEIHGTSQIGERNGFSKLKEDQVKEIILSDRSFQARLKLAKKFSVDITTIGLIQRGKRWTHVHKALQSGEGEK